VAKKKKGQENLHFGELAEMAAKLKDETDRGVALIVAAWIDDALTDFVIGHLLRDEDAIEAMFGGIGPLGTFSSKIKLAYLTRMIGKSIYDNLETIRGIRNEFAHSRKDLKFSEPSINARCNNLMLKRLTGDEATGPGKDQFSPRKAYVATSLVLTGYFIEMRHAPTFSTDGKVEYFEGFKKTMADEMLEMIKEMAKRGALEG
jgi:hypothetical protein